MLKCIIFFSEDGPSHQRFSDEIWSRSPRTSASSSRTSFQTTSSQSSSTDSSQTSATDENISESDFQDDLENCKLFIYIYIVTIQEPDV